MQPIITIQDLSKQYRLGTIGTGTLTHDLKRWWANLRGKEDPTLRIGVENKLATVGGEYVWALQNINLEVQQGEILGIIGKNGAGKSTLLKILSRVTTPTTGTIRMEGRVASLLEVGTGFHGELTGRENVFLNGAIMGMTKKEIKSRFDEIVDFAGVDRYIDTPVKRYSSGMYVRLAFAVAAHLDPEILIVDEVLAVGDAEFQKKAIGKMNDIGKNEGRTVLFVSHNMAAVKNLCHKGLLLKNGSIQTFSSIDKVINDYQISYSVVNKTIEIEKNKKRTGNGKVILSDLYFTNSEKERIFTIFTGDDVELNFILKTSEAKLKNVDVGFSVQNYIGDRLAVVYSSYFNKLYQFDEIGYYTISFKIENIFFNPGQYSIGTRILVQSLESDWLKEKAIYFDIAMGDFYKTGNKGISENVSFLITGKWE